MARSNVTIRNASRIPELKKTLKSIERQDIKVGVFAGKEHVDGDIDMAGLAEVHEFGMTIKPKKGKYLSIPSHKKSKGKSPRDFSDLFFIPTDGGNGLLAKEVGKDRIDVYFVLVKQVVIPERAFIRGGFDENIDRIAKKIKQMLPDVLNADINVDVFLNAIGQDFATHIKKYMNELDSPPNATLTESNKGSSNPLIDTGRLRDSITHKVE